MATSSNNFPQLKSENFNNWIYRVECILEEKGLLNIIKDSKEENKETFSKENAKAKNIIVQCLPDKYLNTVKTCETAKDMIKILKDLFQRKSIISIIQLRRRLINLKQSPNEKLEDYFEKFDNIVRELDCSDDNLTDRDKIAYLLTGLQSKYDTVITAIECNTDLMSATIKLDFVRARLLDEELKLSDKTNRNTPDTQETAFITCYNCMKPGHLSKDCRIYSWRGRGRSRGRSTSRTPRQQYTNHHGNIAVNQNEENNYFSFITTDNLYENSNDSNEYNIKWVIDSGCTDHLINEKYEKYMKNIVQLEKPMKIYIANGDFITTEKKGYIEMTCGKNKINLEALIIKNLSFNLMSVKKMIQNNFEVIFSKDGVKICKQNSDNHVYGSCIGKLFILNANLSLNVSYSANSSSNSEDLWHKRLGHLNRRSLRYMHLPASAKTCSPCMMGKSTRLPFVPITRPRSRYIGELLHTDIAGPVRTTGINGELYYQVIIDDYSHFCSTYLLKTKSEATTNLINYIRRFETENGTRINKIRCDNGGEFKNLNLESFCRERGISIQYTQPYSPQQNGVSERMNRTLYNRVRTLLLETNLPKYLWGEAIACATYQLNRCPSAAINFKTPEAIMRGKTDLSRLRVFGSKTWSVTIPRGDKLAPRSKEMRLVGYAPNGYRLWDPDTNTIVISRDVRFDENDIIYKDDITGEHEQTNNYSYENEEELEEEKQDKNQDLLEKDKSINVKQDISQRIKTRVETQEQENEEQQVTVERRLQRTIKMPKRYEDYNSEEEFLDANIAYCLLSDTDPKTYKEAISKGSDWKKAIHDEVESLKELNTWIEAELPKGKKAIDTKWIFKTKQDGRKKARLVAKGFQTDNIHNVYSPVARVSTIRMMFSQAVQENFPMRQLDVQTAFLNGYLNTEVFIKPPEGVKVTQGKVLKLQRSLYGLREAPKCWNERFHNYIITQGFEQSKHDFCLYSKTNVWLLIWVDDIIVTGKQKEITKTISKLKEEFKVRDLGEVKEYLGMEITREDETLKISQRKMIEKILEKFGMEDCKGAQTPMEQGTSITEEEIIDDVPYRELIGCLIYISTISRPDITFATSYLSRYLDKPTNTMWTTAKRVLRYLKATSNKCLTYNKSQENQLLCYSDADWASDKETRKSVSGCCIFHNGNLVSWFTKKQQTVALSSAEAEFVAAAMAISELVYLKAIILFAHAADLKEKEKAAEPEQNKDKRQTQDEAVPAHLVYRTVRKQEQVAPVEEPQEDERGLSRSATEEYRPGQVYSLNVQELLELQPERKAPLASGQQLQQLYSEPQQQHKENLQQFYYLEPQSARQVSLHPSHAVIARPHYSANGAEASVGAALSVSDSGANPSSSFDQELLALLGQPATQEQPTYAQQQIQQVSPQSIVPQYQQVDRYITKPSKKPTKLRSKVQLTPPQASTAPQQYLIETTNVQQQQPQQQQSQYRPAPQPQVQRPVQALRYTPIQPTPAAAQQVYYQNQEPQGLKIVPAPKLQQPRAQISYRFVPQYQQAEATPKQYRIVEAPRPQAARQEPQRISASSIERPVTYLKRFPEPEKLRTVKYYEQAASEEVRASPQPTQVIGEQYYLRPLYRGVEQRPRYDLQSLGLEQARIAEPTKPPHSAIYVSKNLGPKKPTRQQPVLRVDQPVKLETQQYRQEVQQYRAEQPSRIEQVNIEHHGQSLEDQRAHLPPPRNNKAYTPEEFQALVAAGYAVTPIPVGSLAQQAQSRSSEEPAPAPAAAPQRRPLYSRRNQYLPLRADEAP